MRRKGGGEEGRAEPGRGPKDGEAVAMEMEWGPGKEKAKGQLGNFLKGAENPGKCVPFTGQPSPAEPGLQTLLGSQAKGLAITLGGWAQVWNLIRNICSWRRSSQGWGRSSA